MKIHHTISTACRYLTLLLFAQLASAVELNNAVGIQHQTIFNDSYRPLDITIWYPTSAEKEATLTADNAAFQGTLAAKNAPLKVGNYPLILLSHGYRGHWRNLNWLADLLVKKGYLIAAVDHPGTSTFNHDADIAAQWWERPKDISRTLDWLQHSVWSSYINSEQVSAIGHSLGGWTVMLLAGASVDAHAMRTFYNKHPNPRIESVANEMKLDNPEPMLAGLEDSRINKIVSLDLGLAHSFSVASLKQILPSVMVLGAGIDIGDLPVDIESGFIARSLELPTNRYKIYPKATHFSFMQLCKANAYELLEAEEQGGGIVCLDGEGVTREQLHAEIFQDISHFLTSEE